MEAGDNQGITDDGDPFTHSRSTSQHLVTQLTSSAGKTWKAYQEDIPGQACPLRDINNYAVKHDPFVYFTDVTDGNNPNSPNCIAHIRPYTELAADLRNNAVANYNFITPNLCNDMHDCGVSSGDEWLSREIPKIMGSSAYNAGGAIFITWDESEGEDSPIGMIVLSPFAKGHGYSNTIRYTHSSTLLTLEEIFGLPVRLSDSASAVDLSDLFLNGTQGAVQVVARNSGKCLDVPGLSKDPIQVQQWSCGGGPNQEWNLIPIGGGFYAITSVDSGMSLDVSGSSTADGAAVIQWPYRGGPNQKWFLQATPEGYFQLTAQHSGKCLDVIGGVDATGDGIGLEQWSCLGSTNQQWQLVPAH